jgi:uncharacterized membrane protein YfcA
MGFFGLAGGTVVIPGLMYLAGLEYQRENCRHHRCSDVHNGMDQFAPGRENQRRLLQPAFGILVIMMGIYISASFTKHGRESPFLRT